MDNTAQNIFHSPRNSNLYQGMLQARWVGSAECVVTFWEGLEALYGALQGGGLAPSIAEQMPAFEYGTRSNMAHQAAMPRGVTMPRVRIAPSFITCLQSYS